MPTGYESDPAVSNLRNYLRIRSIHPNVNYDECLTYLRGQAAELGLPVQVYETVPKKPLLVMTWEGLEPTLPTILLNSHMDVVPVFEESWSHPPFEAYMKDGVIYARGVQDMKSVGVQYIEAVRRIKAKGLRLKRTVHICFSPDEEVGGGPGIGAFVKTDAFKALNVGFALDEGIANRNDEFWVFNGERSTWHLKIICPGKSGHSSLLLPDNNAEKLVYMIGKFLARRKQSEKQLADNPNLTTGDVTSINLTRLFGGIQNNIVPEKFIAIFDIRVAQSEDQEQFESEIRHWCAEAGDGVTFEFQYKDPYVESTKLDSSNAFWLAFKAAAKQINIKLKTGTSQGGTDARYLRGAGVPALGFSPISRTVPRLHEHDEHLSADVFLRGIEIYEAVISNVANV